MGAVERRKRTSRLEVMRFVLWVQALPHVPTIGEIAGFANVHLGTAREWRKDWLEARRPPLGKGVQP